MLTPAVHRMAVVIAFALMTAWLLIGTWQSSPYSGQATQKQTSQKANRETQHNDPWLTKDAAGFFTFLLVVVGAFQVGLFYVQLRLIRESLTPAKEAADAARAAAEHIPIVERAYVSGGATGVEGSPQEFAVTVDNYGKTPAFIGTIWANIVPENELPDTPVYAPPEFGRFGGQMLKPDTSGHPVVIRQWDVIEGRVIYGRIWYRDIFKQCHSGGFILRILGPGQTIAVASRDAYWEDRPEPDLGPSVRT
jgi:hypothetical protein